MTIQYDKVIYLITPGPDTNPIAGKHVTVFDYPDGRIKIRFEGRDLPYNVFDRLSQIRQADIVSNKRLGSVLTMARDAQLASNERRSKSCPSRPFPSASSLQQSHELLPLARQTALLRSPLNNFRRRPRPCDNTTFPCWRKHVLCMLARHREVASRCYTCIAFKGLPMLPIRLPPEIEERLEKLAKRTGRS
ncbi:MAG: hypothetical protein ABSG12_09505, partial [Steroidobacteraceae bacterium]